MKIVGGKEIPGTSETGAFVTAIYPGLIADQLHGELEVGAFWHQLLLPMSCV